MKADSEMIGMFDANKVKKQLVAWISDYFRANSSTATKAVVGISGGKDSSVTAALCTEALGKERVLGVLMPHGIQEDIDVSYEICRILEIPHIEIDIEGPVGSLFKEMRMKGLDLSDVTVINTPARMRMTTLYAVSGTVGGRVANTSNLSEDWVGYVTKFGDSAGDFAPLSNLTSGEVRSIGRELGLRWKFIDKTPIDGLCGRTDEESLGFTYEVLDRYIREGICEDTDTKENIDRLHCMSLHKVNPMPSFRPN